MELEHTAIRKQASLVICAIDDFSDKVVSGSNIAVRAGSFKAQRKADGYYVFINLPVSRHAVSIQSDIYFPETIEVDLAEIDRRNPVEYVRLKPNTIYPVPPRSACIRGYAEIDGKAAGGIPIVIERLSDVQSVKIAEGSAKAGSKALKLYKAGNISLEGMEFTIDDKEEESKERIKVIGADGESVVLEKPLKFGHKRGTLLIPYDTSHTDDKGCFMILPRQLTEEKLSLRLHFQNGEILAAREVSIMAGEAANIGTINLKE